MTIWGQSPAPPTPSHFFDLSLLKEEESRSALLTAWEGTEPLPSFDLEWAGWLGTAMDRVLKCNTRLSKEKRKAKGTRFRALQHKIRLAKIQFQISPENERVRNILSEAQGHMADTLQDQVTQNQQLSASSWFRYGDTCSKQFFDYHRVGRKRTPLKELMTEGGTVTG